MLRIKNKFLSIPPVKMALFITLIFGAVQLPFSSFMADDFIQLSVLQKTSPATWISPLDLYNIADGNPKHMQIMQEQGAFPWFYHPEFKLRSFRPLSSLLLNLDYFLFQSNPLGYALHNLLWFLLFVLASSVIINHFFPGQIGRLATIIFSLSSIHWLISYWIAARHILIAGALGLWSFWFYLRWRDNKNIYGRWLSIFGFTLALLAGETALAIMVFLITYELLRASSKWDSIKRLYPLLILGIGYLIYYTHSGYGAINGSGYIHPFLQPLGFLIKLPVRLVAMIGSVFLGGHVDLWILPHLRPYLVGFSILVLIFIVALLKKVLLFVPQRDSKSITRLSIGAFASLMVFSTTYPSVRFLSIPLIGGALIIALIIIKRDKLSEEVKKIHSLIFRIGCWILIIIHLILSPIIRLMGPIYARGLFFNRLKSGINISKIKQEDWSSKKAIVLWVPDFSMGLHSYYFLRTQKQIHPKYWRTLSWENCPYKITRKNSHTIIMELINHGIKITHLKSGDTVALSDMVVRVLEYHNGGISLLEFKFDRSLDDSDFQFLTWMDGKIQPIKLPKIGEALMLNQKI